jgi:hypothetical protein
MVPDGFVWWSLNEINTNPDRNLNEINTNETRSKICGSLCTREGIAEIGTSPRRDQIGGTFNKGNHVERGVKSGTPGPGFQGKSS